MSGLPSARQSFDIDVEESPIEPDFVEADEEEGLDDEEEVARLARERGLGLGGWMDALIGWTLFSVDEDGEVSEEEEEPKDMTEEDKRLMREVEAKRRKMERESIIAASAFKGHGEGSEEGGEARLDVPKPPEGQEAGGWQDAAWLLSVASKALF